MINTPLEILRLDQQEYSFLGAITNTINITS